MDLIYVENYLIISKKHQDVGIWQDTFKNYVASLSFENIHQLAEFVESEYYLILSNNDLIVRDAIRIDSTLSVVTLPSNQHEFATLMPFENHKDFQTSNSSDLNVQHEIKDRNLILSKWFCISALVIVAYLLTINIINYLRTRKLFSPFLPNAFQKEISTTYLYFSIILLASFILGLICFYRGNYLLTTAIVLVAIVLVNNFPDLFSK